MSNDFAAARAFSKQWIGNALTLLSTATIRSIEASTSSDGDIAFA